MPSRQVFRPALFVAGGCLLGCSPGPTERTSNGTMDGAYATPAQEASLPSQQPLVAVAASADASAADAEAPQDPIVPPIDCDIDGGCVSQCSSDQSAVCAVVGQGTLCELQGFAGASVEVGCGQRAIVGTACCGECGCVPVEVYFDGKNCWQGVPTCTTPEWTDQFLNPHAPGAADAGWSSAANNGVPGHFYLGTTDPDSDDASAGDSGSEGGTGGGDDTTIDASGSDSGIADTDGGGTTWDWEPDATTGSADAGAD
jgi:hypothetical protein